jgi:MFS superfamily sulfate permease-like transporter
MSASSASPPPPSSPGRLAARPGTGQPTGWLKWLPGLQTLRQYQIAWLRHDVAAGLVLTTMLVPVGIAYAVASGVPGIYGLYATIIPLLAYALFGPSRIMVLGTGFLAGGRDPRGHPAALGRRPDARRRAGRHDGRGLGHWCASSRASARLGFITELLSKPIRYGYMNGIALTVLISQLPKLFGFSVARRRAAARALWNSREALLAGADQRGRALLVGGATLALILLLKRRQAHPGGPDRRGRGDARGRHARSRRRRRA